MNPPLPRPQAAFQAAVSRLHRAAHDAATRCVDSLGLAALSAQDRSTRDAMLAAQFEINRNQTAFDLAFAERLNDLIRRDIDPQRPSSRSTSQTSWQALRLVDDDEVETQVAADRLAQSIRHACEWELRELDGYMGTLLRLPAAEPERNPLRPDLLGKALYAAVVRVSDQSDVRRTAAVEIGRSLLSLLPRVYGEIVGELRDSGLQPLGMNLRAVNPATSAAARTTSGYDTGSDAATLAGADGGPHTTRARAFQGSGPGRASAGGPPARSGATFGEVDPQLMTLIRRLAHVRPSADSDPMAHDGASAWATSGTGATPNLIYAHRDELRRASNGTLDHMVIDVVGSLFEHILSDPKVPPQMARQIARLQLPVLRVALGDSSFFSSRRHPVRRFVNRIASLGVAFDDLADGPGKDFLGLVRDLVQQIVEGDFDQMDVYERRLVELEAFIAEQAQQEVQQQAEGAVHLLADKEDTLLLQQRYMQRLQVELARVPALPAFVQHFLAQVWSQIVVLAVRRGGEGSEAAQRARRTARELALSVQPKGTPAERKAFLQALPALMKALDEGLASIGWPEAAKKDFYARLLPAHAESLKNGSISQLDYNLLAKQLDTILLAPLPGTGERLPGDAEQSLDDVAAEQSFSADEAQRIGLVRESAVDWDGKVDIDLSADEPEVTSEDVRIEGLPAPDAVEPVSGAALADHVQVGFAYRMQLDDGWQKVRLTHVSPGRAFFVFTRGSKHQRAISMTARMLRRMCESGRLRTFENAYLLERATARARRQLAGLRAGAASR